MADPHQLLSQVKASQKSINIHSTVRMARYCLRQETVHVQRQAHRHRILIACLVGKVAHKK
jgi:hypothetical protein